MLTLKHQVCEKLDAGMFDVYLSNMQKNIFFVTPTHVDTQTPSV